MSSDPSRNEPCPCGSGKKFKRCCIGAERKERSSSALHGKTRSLGRAAELMIERRSQLPNVLERLGRLMRRGGPLAQVRFDWAKLEPAMAGAIWSGELDDRREAVLRQILTPQFVEEAMAQFDEVLNDQTLPAGDLEAIAVAYLMCEVSLAQATDLELNPVFKVLLHVQANERIQGRDTFHRKTRELLQAMRETGNFEVTPATVAEFEALMVGDDQLRASLEKGERAFNQKTFARLRSDAAPQGVLTLEEHLWVCLHIAEALEPGHAEPALQKTGAQAAVDALDLALDDGFLDEIGARLERIARAEAQDLARRAEWELLRSVYAQNPLIFLASLAAAGKSRPSLRSPREAELFAEPDAENAPQLISQIAADLEAAGAKGPSRLMRRVEERFFST